MDRNTIKLVSYNVNGIRAAIRKGFANWLGTGDYDIVLLQEIKAEKDQIPEEHFSSQGYMTYWFPARKRGYSGTGILTRIRPDYIEYGMSNELYDSEGRVMRMDIGDVTVVNAYFPSGSSGDHRQEIKMQFLEDIHNYMETLRLQRPRIILSGDFNICHRPIDIHDPVRNKNTSGFLPEEREWMDAFFNNGFIDTFRVFNKDPHQYSWWTYRAGARANNKGWRIDYHTASEDLRNSLVGAAILPEAEHSDHCPVLLEIMR